MADPKHPPIEEIPPAQNGDEEGPGHSGPPTLPPPLSDTTGTG